MVPFLTFIHVLNCGALIIVVLLQAGRGAGMAGVFGASAAGTQIFGGRGAGGFLGRATAIMAVVFMCTSIALTLARTHAPAQRSVVREAAQQMPAAPGGAPAGEPTGGMPSGGSAAPVSPAPGAGGSAAPEGAGGGAAPGGGG